MRSAIWAVPLAVALVGGGCKGGCGKSELHGAVSSNSGMAAPAQPNAAPAPNTPPTANPAPVANAPAQQPDGGPLTNAGHDIPLDAGVNGNNHTAGKIQRINCVSDPKDDCKVCLNKACQAQM